MKYFYVQNGTIAGLGDTDDVPFACIANMFGGSIDPNDFCVVDGKIELRPERPSPDHVWADGGWVKPTPIDVSAIVSLNPWQTLLDKLRGSEVWEAAFSASVKSLRAQSAWTILYGTITSTNNLQDLAFSLGALIDAAPALFTIEVKAKFKEILAEVGLLDASLEKVLQG